MRYLNQTCPILIQRIIAAMLLLVALRCLGASAYRAAVAPTGLFSVDFLQYYSAAARVNAGDSLYLEEESPGQLKYQHVSSPFLPILVRPLSQFTLEQARQIWAGINVSLLILAGLLFCWGTGFRILDDIARVLLVIFCGFRFMPTTLELGIGNSDIVLLTLMCGMFVCIRYEKWILFAALIALATMTKTWMIGALFFLIVRRKWGAAVACVGFLTTGLAIAFFIVGWHQWSGWLRVTHYYASQPTLVSNSVAGIARMYFTKNDILTPLLESRICWMAAMAAGYGVLIAGLAYLWSIGGRLSEAQSQMCLALIGLALILGSPVSHQQYFVLALPAIWLLLVGPEHGWKLRIAAFSVYLLFTLHTPGQNPIPEEYSHGINSLKVAGNFLGGMALWGMGLFAVARGFCTEKETPHECLRPISRGETVAV